MKSNPQASAWRYTDMNMLPAFSRRRAIQHASDVSPVRHGRPLLSRDVTTAHGVDERLRFLAEASRALSSCLDVETTLATATHLCVPSFADRCVVYVGDTLPVLVARASCADQAQDAYLDRAIKLSQSAQTCEYGLLARVLRSGQPSHMFNVSEKQLDRMSPELAELLRSLRTRSVIVAPLTARGRTLGAMSFAVTGSASGRRYVAADLALAVDVAERCALALDNARLFGEATRAEAVLYRDLSAAKLLAILHERERIAMDLHDGVIQSLYGMTLGLVAAELKMEQHPVIMRQAVRRATGQIDDIIQDIRAYIFNLRNREFGAGGLRAGLGAIADRLRDVTSAHVDVRLDPWTDNLLSPDASGQLLQIAQEAVANVRRHAAARHVVISLARSSSPLILTVTDDGCGFDPLAAPPETSLGLRNIRERARRLGGDVSIQSALGHGTAITVTIPALVQDEME